MTVVGGRNSIDSIAIVANEHRDASLVANLLKDSGLDPARLQVCESGKLDKIEKFAVVMCHRRQTEQPLRVPPDELLPRKVAASRVIVLSDCTSEGTVLKYLEHGARHVFSLGESSTLMQARLVAALRQHGGISRMHFTVGDIHFDIQKRKVYRAGEAIDLSPKEFEFASRVFINVDEVVKNADLMTSVWSLPQHMDTRRIDTAACRVRKKLRLSHEEGWLLKRIRCVGYRLSRVSPEV